MLGGLTGMVRSGAGFGFRHPELTALLTRLAPASQQRIVWPGGFVLDAAAYTVPVLPPEPLISSVRCIVRVGRQVVVCHAPDEEHILPGGRREAGETYQQTVRREVHEETGWLVEADDLRLLGFLHFQHVGPVPAGHPYPHPDFLQLVYTAPAREHADQHPAGWTDLAGWEQGHRLVGRDQLDAVPLSDVQRAFLAVLPD